MTQDEVMWVLETLKDNWPGLADSGAYGEGLYGDGAYYDEDGFPHDLYRINRDEPLILETGERKRRGEFSRANFIGASKANRSTTPTNDGFRVETVVNVKLEGVTERKHGHIEDAQHFDYLARYARHAIDVERSYPTVDADDDIGRVAYHSALTEGEADRSNEKRDHYRRDFDVRLVGYECLP